MILDLCRMAKVKLILSCKHEERITAQVRPTIDLLANMDEWHPDVLLQHSIQPADYKGALVFRSAVESIRGTFAASMVNRRQGLISDILENLLKQKLIYQYEKTSGRARYDFGVRIMRDPDYFAALEVKGGEGNSINISERPIWAREFVVWSHLDGAIVNQPAHGVHSIINRLANEMVRRKKLVDALFIKDALCGTSARPCPKYPDCADRIGLQAAPDIFLFPRRVPSADDPNPPVHTLDTIKLPRLILDLFRVDAAARDAHLWEVHVRIVELPKNRLRRLVEVRHLGEIVGVSKSRAGEP